MKCLKKYSIIFVVFLSFLLLFLILRNHYCVNDPNDYRQRAEKILEKMSVDEKISQMLFSKAPITGVKEAISHFPLGGLILFDYNISGKTFEEIKTMIGDWQTGQKIKLFIGIDEEGGSVSRLSSSGPKHFDSPQTLFKNGGMDLILKDTEEKISVLDSIGVNVNFAPVADVCEDKNSYIYNRTFGQSFLETADYIGSVVEKYQGTNVSSTLKHFPGYGCNLDAHDTASSDTRDLDILRKNDFLPFLAGIDSGADFVMFSHNITNNVDKKPASFSLKFHEILRDELGFTGIMITDDLSMAAVKDCCDKDEAVAVQAVLAGNNMLIVSDPVAAFYQIKEAASNGEITEERLNELLMPVLLLKIRKGLVE